MNSTTLYSSNSDYALLKDFGPYRQAISDNTIKGITIYGFENLMNLSIIPPEIVLAESEKIKLTTTPEKSDVIIVR